MGVADSCGAFSSENKLLGPPIESTSAGIVRRDGHPWHKLAHGNGLRRRPGRSLAGTRLGP
jgi:hypothetical protein